MESIGTIFKTVRAEKDISIDKVARHTKIAKQLIEALEEENFEVFPGETYLIGFIRVYSEFLELDPEQMIGLYRNTVMQEQPLPVDELIGKRSSALGKILAIGSVSFLVLAVIVLSVIFFTKKGGDDSGEVTYVASSTVHQYSGGKFLKRVQVEDKVAFTVADKDYLLSIGEIDETGVMFLIGDLSYSLEFSQARDVDVNSDAEIDLSLSASDYDAKKSSFLLRISNSSMVISDEIVEVATPTLPEYFILDNSKVSSPARSLSKGSLGSVAKVDNLKLTLKFSAFVYAEIVREKKVEVSKGFSNGDTYAVDLTTPVIISVSNGGKTSLSLGDNSLKFGSKEHFACYLIKADYDVNNKRYNIEAIPYY
ncbi:MAG: helix-turn-helix domain-containing protein [Spirochaetales bacterium]|nr:helix-turn-helix domain-containing protein [Spirochaetales bacterium]